MNARTPFLLAVIFSACASLAPAQFGGLGKVLDKAKEVAEPAKDALKVAKGAAGIGPEEEKIIGDSVALEVIGMFGGLVRDEAITLRVNLVGRALARYSDRPDHPWRFGVLDSDTVNAFSAPDGYVFITRGLYNLATDDNLLAGILAHEIGHITGRHALKIVERGEFITGASSLAARRSKDLRNVEAVAQQFDLGIGKIINTLLEKGFDPKTEYTADGEGRRLAAIAGYAPGGLRATLIMLQARKGDPKKTFSTHPPLGERIKRLPDEPAPATSP